MKPLHERYVAVALAVSEKHNEPWALKGVELVSHCTIVMPLPTCNAAAISVQSVCKIRHCNESAPVAFALNAVPHKR